MTGIINIHGTAVVLGTRGILFAGSSGSGKSALALACIAAARREGAFAALVADDRVLISKRGIHIVASCPAPITGLIELRGSGIAMIGSVPAAVLDLAVSVVSLPETDRLPPENECLELDGIGSLPLVRLPNQTPEPLASLAALIPAFRHERPF